MWGANEGVGDKSPHLAWLLNLSWLHFLEPIYGSLWRNRDRKALRLFRTEGLLRTLGARARPHVQYMPSASASVNFEMIKEIESNMRNRSTTSGGRNFDDASVNAVWNKGKIVSGYDPQTWRKDACDAWINRAAYGDTTSKYGWEIDHIVPVARGGSDQLSNLQPLQWENNRAKSDGPLACTVRS